MPGALASIIIPYYEGGDWLVSSVKSALDQTYPDKEVIVVDDGSKVSAQSLLKEFDGQKNLVCIKKETNEGVAKARNRGIQEAKGAYIAFLDQDDVWLSEKLELQIKEFERNPEYGLVYSDVEFMVEGQIRPRYMSQRRSMVKGRGRRVVREIFFMSPIMMSSVVVKAECFRKLGPLFEDTRYCDDSELFLRIAGEYHIGYVRRPLVLQRLHGNNNSLNNDYRDDLARFFGMAADRYPELAGLKEKKLLAFHLSNCVNDILKRRFDKAAGELKKINELKKRTDAVPAMLAVLIKLGAVGCLGVMCAKYCYDVFRVIRSSLISRAGLST